MSMSHAEHSPAAVGGGVRRDPRSVLGVAMSPVSATMVHPPVGGPDQKLNPLTASPVSNHTRFHQLVRRVAIRLETTRVPYQTTIPVFAASQQAEVSAITSLVALNTKSTAYQHLQLYLHQYYYTSIPNNYLPALTQYLPRASIFLANKPKNQYSTFLFYNHH